MGEPSQRSQLIRETVWSFLNFYCCLCDELISDRFNYLRCIVLSTDKVGWSRADWLTLQFHPEALSSGLSLLQLVLLHASEEVQAAVAVLDVLDTDVNFLRHDSSSAIESEQYISSKLNVDY